MAGNGQSGERAILGSPRSMVCRDCGELREQGLCEVSSWLAIWAYPEHACPERLVREEREAQAALREAALAAAAHAEWLRDPPEERRREVRRRVGLPGRRVAPAGLDRVDRGRLGEGSLAALTLLLDHREQWLAGRRPERGLWLWGETDRQKSVLTAALAFDVAHRTERAVTFWNLAHLMEEKQAAAQDRPSAWDQGAIDRAELLVLDDIGTVNVTPAAWKTLYGLAEHALSGWGGAEQVLYVSSNESPAAVVDLFALRGDPDAGERIVRRLRQLCEVVHVGGGCPLGAGDREIPALLRQKADAWDRRQDLA